MTVSAYLHLHPKMDHDTASATLIRLIEDYHDYNTGGVCEYAYPTAIEFSKQVSRGRPCVYNVRRGEAHHSEFPRHMKSASELADAERKTILSCKAFSWTAQSLCAKVPDQVEVAVTPDGRADSLYRLPRHRGHGQDGRMRGDEQDESEGEAGGEQVFVQPATTYMSLSSLLEILQPSPSSDEKVQDSETPPTSTPVYYLQSQNSNLTSTPLTPLLDDLPPNLPFAVPILGEPEAINIWIGDDRSVTSTHRDPYENLYLVLRGTKTFTLYAPVEELCLHAKMVRTARLVRDEAKRGQDDEFRIEMDESASFSADVDDNDESGESEGRDGRIPWVPISPLLSRAYLNRTFPYYKHARPQTVKVEAGQMLYLPSGWFHHVRQDCGTWDDESIAPCIAVNYWFDMDYEGERFAMRQMIGSLADTVRDSSRSSWGVQIGEQKSH